MPTNEYAARYGASIRISHRQRQSVDYRRCVEQELRLRMADQLINALRDGRPYTVRMRISEEFAPPSQSFAGIGYTEPPDTILSGDLDIRLVETMNVRVYEMPSFAAMPWRNLSDSAAKEIRRRIERRFNWLIRPVLRARDWCRRETAAFNVAWRRDR